MLSENLKNIRTEKGMSQEELAVALGVVRQTVSKWEKGLSVPDADILVRLAHVLGTSVNELLGEEEPAAPVADAPKKRAPKWWEITLIALGFPVWFPLAVAALAVVLSLYIVVCAVVISLWAVDVSLGGGTIGGIIGGVIFLCTGSIPSGIIMIAAGLICAGLSIFLFFGCKAATDGVVRLTKGIAHGIKTCFIRRDAV